MTDDGEKERLKDCLATVQNLKEENQQLRRAAASFGQLAERLNEALASERRVPDHDRRRERRDGSDRRTQTQHG
jgi:predicted RNase H-like nuclease (RuvC/YqgF family)